MDWTDGYAADTEYTSHYFSELAPPHLDLIALMAGVLPPEREGGRFRYCELGCGNGMSTSLLAACHPNAKFLGIDFMPVHVANARRAAKAGGLTNVEFLEMSFADACRQDFQPFDYIVAHGVYSWITAQNRAEMVEFFRRFLAPGGLVYLSYNTYPGWLPIAPLQKLVSEHAKTLTGPSTKRVLAAFEFAGNLLGKGALALAGSPATKAQLEKAPSMAPNYLAQEYLNEAWYPLYVTDVMREVSAAKLEYVTSATMAENDMRYLVSDELAAIIRGQPSEELRQLVKDICINARFRRDIYTRGGRRLSGQDQRQMLGERIVGLARAAEVIEYSVEYSGRKIAFDTPIGRAMVQALRAGPLSIGEIAQAAKAQGATDGLRSALEMTVALCVGNQALPLDPPGPVPEAMNLSLVARAMEDTACNALATGRGAALPVAPLEMALLSNPESLTSVEAGVRGLKEIAQRKGRMFNRKGVPLKDPAEIDAFLAEEVKGVLTNRGPTLRQFGLLSTGAAA